MSDPPLSRASAAFEESGEISDSAASGRESQESGENFLCSQGGWRSEAESVIRDVQKFVKKIEIAEKIQSGPSQIYLNVTTLEDRDLTIELSASGFRVASTRCHDDIDPSSDESPVFETPYSLLESVSPAYVDSFGKELVQRLASLQNE